MNWVKASRGGDEGTVIKLAITEYFLNNKGITISDAQMDKIIGPKSMLNMIITEIKLTIYFDPVYE